MRHDVINTQTSTSQPQTHPVISPSQYISPYINMYIYCILSMIRTSIRGPIDHWRTFVGSPQPLHAVPQQDDASELRERLGDVEVAQRADLEEGDAQLLRVHLRLLGGHLTLVGQVETVPHQDLGHPRGMLGKQETGDCDSLEMSEDLNTDDRRDQTVICDLPLRRHYRANYTNQLC